MTVIKQRFTKIGLALLVVIFTASFVFSYEFSSPDSAVYAATEQELLQQSHDLEKKIQENEKTLEGISKKRDTLENKLAAIQVEINTANHEIELIQVKIKQLTVSLNKAEKELSYQETILKESIRTLYIEGDVTNIELLFAADNLSDFFDQQEYLERLKVTVQESADKVKAIKKSIEAEKLKQEELLMQLEGQRKVLQDKRSEQDSVLQKTRGQESTYQEIIANLKEEKEKAEAALQAFASSGNYVSLGPVNAGDIVGTVGNTGFSSGPHLHFEVRNTNGAVVNPMGWRGGNWRWPVAATNGYTNNGFGEPGPYASGYHPGIDTGYNGAPVIAMAAGEIIARGCSSDYLGTPAYGYMVMIQHSDGYKTLYAHMKPPAGSTYAHCSTSYGF